MPTTDIADYRLNWGYGTTVKAGDSIYRGSDAKPIAYTIRRLIFETGYGVRIVTDSWSDCGLHCAATPEEWKQERINYLNWRREPMLRDIAKIDAEISELTRG